MNFDFKITTWERINVPENLENEVLNKIKSGEITSSNEIFDFCDEASFEIIPEIEEQMTTEENGGSATIEVYNEGNIIFDNGKFK